MALDKNEDPLFSANELKTKLERDYKFDLKKTIFGGELYVFVHPETGGVVLLHSALSKAGDSREKGVNGDFTIPMEQMCLRSMTAAVIQGVMRRFMQKSKLPRDAPFENILLAYYNQEATVLGWHQSRRIAACAFRDRITPETVNAFKKSRLAKSSNDEDCPLFRNLRSVYYGNIDRCKDLMSDRPVDRFVIDRAVNVLSFAEDPSKLTSTVTTINKIFGNDDNLRNKRWEMLFDRFEVPTSPACKKLLRQIRATRDSMLKNLSNREERRGQIREDLVRNKKELNEKIPLILKSKTKQFWVREYKADAEELEIVPQFDDTLQVIKYTAYEGINEKFRKMFGGNTNTNNTQRLKTSTVEGSGLQIPAGEKLTISGKNSKYAIRKEGFIKATLHIKNK